MKRTFFCLYLLIASILTSAQVPGTWNEYFSFRNVQQLESVDDNVFALSGNGIFIYNTTNQEIQKITKLNGLSNVGLTCFAFCDSTSSFLIGYSDGTLDILHYPSLKVQSIPTIAQKNIYGSKNINSIAMHNDTAIIASDFGVLTFSMSSYKFISTTILSNDGSFVPTKSIAYYNNKIYAATTKGIFTVSLNYANLSDFSIWEKLTNISHENDTISHIAALNGTIYYAHINSADRNQDSIFKITNGKSEAFKTQKSNITHIYARNNQLCISSFASASIYNQDEMLKYQFDEISINSRFYDIVKLANGNIFVGDKYYGLYEYSTKNNIIPNCPLSNHVTDLYFQDNALHMVCGNIALWEKMYYNVKHYDGTWYGHSDWQYNNSICVYPVKNSGVYYVGTYGNGFSENEVAWETGKTFDASNSILQTYYLDKTQTVVNDITTDSKGTLWILNSGNNNPIVARDKNNNWYSYYIAQTSGNIINQKNLFKQFIIDRRGYKWLAGTGNLTVFYENGTLDNTDDDAIVRIPLADNEGTIASQTTCVVEDLNGEIWIGTNQGIAVHSSPSRVFRDRQNISRIKIEIDGEVGYLLSSENITCIAVDGANRKWIGTENSGIFLISENGTEQLLNYTKTNSPLPSNTIKSLAIDHTTGEVYIGTEEGLVSYTSDATAGDMAMNDIYIFPNPVRETYDGNIFIKGVVADAIIKITDISGNLVRTVNANGGTGVWDGRNTFGDRVSTGVYLIYISDETGEYTKVSKILFIH